jgi:alpha-1,3-rhamnosyl/mannosyltransferase
MNVDLGVEALAPQLTGIGRYTLELMRGLQDHPEVDQFRAIYNGMTAADPEGLLRGVIPQKRKRRTRWLRWSERAAAILAPRRRIYHGPNFMLPANVQGGIITVHDLSVYKFPEMHPPERVKHFERNFAQSLDRAWHIITDTDEVRQELAAFANIPEDRITSVHLGVNPAYRPDRAIDGSANYASYGIEPNRYILLVATFEPRKRIDAALAAYRLLPEALKRRYPLVLAGAAGWQNEALHEIMAQDEAKGYIRFLGFVPESDLPGIYGGAKLFLYPSIYEGFGLPPIEAMASGVPVIVSNRSCLPEVTAGAAMMIDPDDTESFALAIMRGLEDEFWRAEAIEKGLEVSAVYTWEKCVEQTVDVYRAYIY